MPRTKIGVCTAGGWLTKRRGETDTQRMDRVKRDLDRVAAAGLDGIRWDCSWSAIEYDTGQYAWELRIAVAKELAARGLTQGSLQVAGYTPQQYRAAEFALTANAAPPPVYYDAWVAFWVEMITVFGELGLDWYEAWNECNHFAFMRYADPVVMATMAKLARVEARKINPKFKMVFGAFSPAPDKAGPDGRRVEINPVTYVEELYAKRLQACADAISLHPYVGPARKEKIDDWHPGADVPWSLLTTQYDDIRAVMDTKNPGKKILATEFGFTTNDRDSGGRPKMTQAQQARCLTEQIQVWWDRPGAGQGYIFALNDFTEPDGNVNGLGLCTLDGKPKQSYHAVKELLA